MGLGRFEVEAGVGVVLGEFLGLGEFHGSA